MTLLKKNPTLFLWLSDYFEKDFLKNHIIESKDFLKIDEKLKLSKGLINLLEVNEFRYINKYFEKINSNLIKGDLFCSTVLTYPQRKDQIFKKYPFIFAIFIFIIDSIFYRIFPKLALTKKIFFLLTKGRGRLLSRAETYGRLYSCGFEIVDEKIIHDKLYFIFKKISDPVFDNRPTYGPFIQLIRLGKNRKEFKVYKIRTMHPYSEYLQEYIFQKNNLQKGGKINDDFRISVWGRFLRKFWIDEIPMILNIFYGDIKLVGVRPLSKHFFSLYSKELQEERIKYKPGFIPPYYVDLPETIEEIMQSELKYLKAYEKSPILTDLKYLIISLKNVIFKGARSS